MSLTQGRLMKILYTNFHRGDGGGHTTYIGTLARSLGSAHEITVAVPGTSRLYHELSQAPGVRVADLDYPTRLSRLAGSAARLGRLVDDGGFDIVHANGSADHRCVMFSRLLHTARRRPRVVFTKHDHRNYTGLGATLRARLATDHVIAVSDDSYQRLAASAYRRCPLTLVRNGIDTERYRPWTDDAVAQARAPWLQDGETRLIVGSNAGTAEYKNWIEMVQAVALLPEALRRQVRVVLAGHPPSAQQLERVRALGLADRVHFTGLVQDVRPVVAAFDIGFVLSNQIETISFACREMMAMGKPVIVSRFGGLPENVDDGRDGWVAGPGNPQAVADLLAQALRDPQRLAPMGRAARAKSERAFSVAGFVRQTEQVYEDVLRAAAG